MPGERARRVAVVGDFLLDAYVTGSVTRVCPDAPAAVLDASDELCAPGGAANVAAGCAAHGLEVVACGLTGRDAAGSTLETLLAEAGVRLDALVSCLNRSTLVKRRFCAGSQVVFRADEGTTHPANDDVNARLVRGFAGVDAIVVSDYVYGAMSPLVLRALAERRAGMQLIVDAKRLALYREARPDIVKPNYQQLLALVDEPYESDRVAHVTRIAERALRSCGARSVVVTLDSDGAVLLARGTSSVHVPAPPTETASTSGAGDTFLVALTAGVLAGSPLVDAVRSATFAASRACTSGGTAGAHRPFAAPAVDRRKRISPEQLRDWALRLHAEGKRIAVTNGCFDIFHAGHAEFLQAAARAGDVLLVAVNTDESVRRLKGDGRPVNALEDRLRVVEAMGVVDAVTWFDDETAAGVVAEVRPDAYVKGSDYRGMTFPEATFVRRHGGEVVFVDLLEGRSTTSIVERVREGVVLS